MCGIAVVIGGRSEDVIGSVTRMNSAQRHRGPDDVGLLTYELPHGRTIGLGFQRLSIQDLSASGHQPMVHAPSGTAIVFNGEIYNFKELRQELAAGGYVFRSGTDTEVILAGHLAWGCEVFRRLAGMYAIALFDPGSATLTLARDPLGIKPLYLARTPDGWAVASEVRALRASGIVSTVIDMAAVGSFLAYGSVQAPLTVLEAVKSHDSGAYTTFDLRKHEPSATRTRFWSFPAPMEHPPEAAIVRREVGALLRKAVGDHLVADVPVGIFLSGGVDSTALLKLACEIRPHAVDAFTVSVGQDTPLDEAPVAADTARLYGARFHRVEVSDAQASQDFDDWLNGMDQPTIDGLNTFVIVNAVKKQGFTVALSGLGADEMFGGYHTFWQAPLAAMLSDVTKVLPRAWRDALPRRLGRRLLGRPREAKALESFLLAEGDGRRATLAQRRLCSNVHLEAIGFPRPETLGLTQDWLPPEHEVLCAPKSCDPTAVRQAEMLGYMSNTLLRDSDTFSMNRSVELRVPFLDQRVVDYVLSMPLPHAHAQPSKKATLDEACGGLPKAVLGPKRGFSLDYQRFIATRLPTHVDIPMAAFSRDRAAAGAKVRPATLALDTHRALALWLARSYLG